jgi:hypothetical protein
MGSTYFMQIAYTLAMLLGQKADVNIIDVCKCLTYGAESH